MTDVQGRARCTAAIGLWQIEPTENRFLEVSNAALQNALTRTEACFLLQRMGSRAKPATPILKAALEQASGDQAPWIQQVIKKIEDSKASAFAE